MKTIGLRVAVRALRISRPIFANTYVVGVAVRLKYAKPPLEAKALPLNQKRKRDRPSKAKKGLIVQ